MTVFKAILTGEGSLYGNLMQDNFHKTAVPKKKKRNCKLKPHSKGLH